MLYFIENKKIEQKSDGCTALLQVDLETILVLKE